VHLVSRRHEASQHERPRLEGGGDGSSGGRIVRSASLAHVPQECIRVHGAQRSRVVELGTQQVHDAFTQVLELRQPTHSKRKDGNDIGVEGACRPLAVHARGAIGNCSQGR
jgi:hypothetical protein